MKIDEVRHIVSLGAGTMGQQIALQCAMHGYDVTPCRSDADYGRSGPKSRLAFITQQMEAGFDEHDAARRFGVPGNNPHRCSVAFHDVSGIGLSSALFTNSTESIAAPS